MNIYKKFQKELGFDCDWKIIDDLVVTDKNILRPVKGHGFEIIFSKILQYKLKAKILSEALVGDSDIDLNF